jgi:hypothetical protein
MKRCGRTFVLSGPGVFGSRRRGVIMQDEARDDPHWTRSEVPPFLNQCFQGAVTLAEAVEEARKRFPNQKPVLHREVDRYVEVFVLDLLRIVTTPNLIDALLTAETPKGRLGNLTRP